MITKTQMERYKKFHGEINEWVRSQKNGLDEVLSGAEWTSIDKLVQRLRIQKNSTASLDYKNETERLLKKNMVDEEVIQIARGMA